MFLDEACTSLLAGSSVSKATNPTTDFHGAMALFIAGLDSPTDKAHAAAQAQHMCWALQMVNARLSGPDSAAEENMAVILTLGMYERYIGSSHRGLVHLDGLRRIVEMRGGVAGVARTSPLLAKGMFRYSISCPLNTNRIRLFLTQII
jgi:hypothetical protein